MTTDNAPHDHQTTSAAHIDVSAWAQRFALLADPTRLALLIAMHAHPGSPVTALAAHSHVSQNAASQALRALREQGWIDGHRVGRTVHYRLHSDSIVHQILHNIIGAAHH